MTITVRSNDSVADAQVNEPVQNTPEPKDTNLSAPEAKATEQNQTTEESETSDVDAKVESEEKESEESESSEDETESKDAEKDKPGKKKGGFQRRIDKLNTRYTAAQAEIEYWKQEAMKSQGAPKQSSTETANAQTATPADKPNPDKYDTHAEYVEALADWTAEKKLKARDDEAKSKALKVEQDNALKAHADRVTSFAKETEDFHDVLENVEDIPLSPTVQELILTSDNGPALMYELAKDRDAFAKLCKMSPVMAAREMGRIESKLSPKASQEENTEPKNKTSKAPKPIAPVSKGSGSAVGKSIFDQNISQAEYEKLRREQIKRRGA